MLEMTNLLEGLETIRTFNHAVGLANSLNPDRLRQDLDTWAKLHGGHGPEVPSPELFAMLLSRQIGRKVVGVILVTSEESDGDSRPEMTVMPEANCWPTGKGV